MIANRVSGNPAATLSIAAADDEGVVLSREKREARDVAFLRGGCQRPPSDPQLSDRPLEPNVGPVVVRVVDASRLRDESDSELPVAHQSRLILSDPRSRSSRTRVVVTPGACYERRSLRLTGQAA